MRTESLTDASKGMPSFSNKLKDDHIFRMTDDTGMLQHSKYSIPDPNHGYTTDDNARALIMAVMLYERYKKKKYLDLIYRYASFLLNAQNENGRFKNFMGYDRQWLEEEGSEDCFGRCLWALGFAASNKYTPLGIRHGLSHMLQKAMPNVPSIISPRAKAYSIIGLVHLVCGTFGGLAGESTGLTCDETSISNTADGPGYDGGGPTVAVKDRKHDARRLVYETALSLCSQYEVYKDREWKWFEDIVAYCNYVLPWSLIEAYRAAGERRFLDVALESLGFLSRVTFRDGCFRPVGCNGWLLKGGEPAEYDEQTVEACEGVLAYLGAYDVTGEKCWLQMAKKCHQWYEGHNSRGACLIDSGSGGCYDGLTKDGPNLNMGAESLVSYCISYLKISEQRSI